jgi:Trypsin-like peptidase domain
MSLPDAADVVRPSVVQVRVRLPSAREWPVLGTGFIVHDDGYALTARHVIEAGRTMLASQGGTGGGFIIGLAQPNTENMRGNFTLVEGHVIEEDPRHDLALLQLNPNPFKQHVGSGIMIGDTEVPVLYGVASLDPSRPRDGENIAVSGYPLNEPVLITRVSHFRSGCSAAVPMRTWRGSASTRTLTSPHRSPARAAPLSLDDDRGSSPPGWRPHDRSRGRHSDGVLSSR